MNGSLPPYQDFGPPKDSDGPHPPQEQNIEVVMEPINDKILIQPMRRLQQKSQIHIPDVAKAHTKNKPYLGLVLKVGDYAGRVPETGKTWMFKVQPGDVVAFIRTAGSYIEIQGRQFVFCSEAAVLCKIRRAGD